MAKLTIKEKYNNITLIHHVDNHNNLWGSSGRKVFKKQPHNNWKKHSEFPFSIPRDIFGFSRPSTRAARADKCNIYVNRLGNVIGIRDSIVYSLTDKHPPQKMFSINGDSVLHGGICEDDQGNIYFGEYYMNANRDPVRIWRVSPSLENWEIAHTFPNNSIRHIHGIYSDPYEPNSFWVTTGDFKNECFFFNTRDNFKSFDKFGEGNQKWRAVRLFFTPSHICWLTDSNLEQNYVCRFDKNTGGFEIGQQINASGWYGYQTDDQEFVAFTTVEPGPGIKTNYSEILVSNDGFNWKSIFSFKKDFLRPMKLFKYGVISCPSGNMDFENFYISGEGLRGLDGISYKIRIQIIK